MHGLLRGVTSTKGNSFTRDTLAGFILPYVHIIIVDMLLPTLKESYREFISQFLPQELLVEVSCFEDLLLKNCSQYLNYESIFQILTKYCRVSSSYKNMLIFIIAQQTKYYVYI